MKLKMSNVLAMQSIYSKIKDQIMPISLTYKFARLFKSFQELADFYSTELNKLIIKYSIKDENGQPVPIEGGQGVKIQPDLLIEAQGKISELLQLEVDVPDITFTLQEFDNIHFSLDDFNQFLPFIQEQEKDGD